jgi:hypothetical protein
MLGVGNGIKRVLAEQIQQESSFLLYYQKEETGQVEKQLFLKENLFATSLNKKYPARH